MWHKLGERMIVKYILRGVFILLSATVTILYVLPYQEDQQVQFAKVVLMIALTLGVAAVIIAVDVFTPNKRLSSVSGVFLGLIAGLLGAYALSFVVDLIGVLVGGGIPNFESRQAFDNLMQGVKVLIGLITCYVSISLVLQTKDDFRFVIPYVEFSKQIRGNRPLILDTSVIIDGRIVDIIATNVVQGTLVVPKFVLNELQAVADSSDKLRRARGRRGLDIMQKLQENDIVEVTIDDTEPEGMGVDQKLVALAQVLQARVMTNDFNLAKIAAVRGVKVVNLNDLAKSLRPVALPGEGMRVKVVKPGEAHSQGVGYLEDGTMVVVENARQYLNRDIELTVTSTLQTSAGRMIFGRFEAVAADEPSSGPGTDSHDGGGSPGDKPSDGQPPANEQGPGGNGPRRTTVGRNPRRTG